MPQPPSSISLEPLSPLESGRMRLQFWDPLGTLCPPPKIQVPLTRVHEASHGDTAGFLTNAECFLSRGACFLEEGEAGRTLKAILRQISPERWGGGWRVRCTGTLIPFPTSQSTWGHRSLTGAAFFFLMFT